MGLKEQLKRIAALERNLQEAIKKMIDKGNIEMARIGIDILEQLSALFKETAAVYYGE